VCDIQKGGRGLNVDNLHLVVNRLLIDVDSVDRLQRSVVGMNVSCVRRMIVGRGRWCNGITVVKECDTVSGQC
jgi:hypothetical protein